MEHRANAGRLRTVAARYGLVLVAGWTATILAIFGWNVSWYRQELLEAAASEARGFTKLNFHYRTWNSRVGGLYVAADKVTPNPYLTIPNREVTTQSGTTLTMVNPAYMTRMVFSAIKADPDLPQPILGRLVSRQPLNPANAADSWERRVLHELEAGQTRERWQVTKIDDVPYLRLLSRFVTEESCLKCHAVQGHALGEVRGGISIAVPLVSYAAIERRTLVTSTLGFLLLWCCGTAGITTYSRRRSDQNLLLRASEEKFRGYIDNSPVGVFVMDGQGYFLEVNRAVCTMTGFTETELMTMNGLCLLSADSLVRARGGFQELAETGSATCSLEYCHRDGTRRWWAVDVVSIATDRYLGFVRDITEIKSAEQRLRFQSMVLDQINDAVTVTNLQGTITYVNEAQARQFGGTRDDLLGKSVACFGDDALQGATQQEIISRTLTEGEWCGEVANCDSQGRWFIMEAHTTLICDEGGQAVGMCSVARDVTERKSAEQALQASLAEKDVLLREVHHRVKNNLAAICGLLDLQCLTLDEPDAKKLLTELSGRVRSMSLVHEQLYRSESLANINCQEYLQTLVTGLCSSYPSDSITCSVSAEGVSILLDEAVPCGLIVTELVTNALKYAFPDGWSLSNAGPNCINVSLSRDQNVYTLSVADNGVGLPEGFVWTAAKTLGLVLVRMLGQHQLGGEWAISRAGGTCFTLTFTPGIRRNNHD